MDLKSFVGGCLGGFAGILSSYPFDTIKVRIQNQHASGIKYRSAIDCLIRTVKNESVSALYKGVNSPLVGSMLITALLFGVEQNVRQNLRIDDASSRPQYHLYAISGSIAGFTQAFLLSPVELIKIKMQITQSRHTSTWQCARQILASEKGLRRLTRGTWLTVLRDVPGVGSYFVGFEYICNSLNRSRDSLTVVNLLTAGGLAGCFSWIVTYPIDVIKTRYQADFRAFPNNAAVFATVTLFNRFFTKMQGNEDSYDHLADNITKRPVNLQADFLMDTYDIHR